MSLLYTCTMETKGKGQRGKLFYGNLWTHSVCGCGMFKVDPLRIDLEDLTGCLDCDLGRAIPTQVTIRPAVEIL